MNKIKHFFKQDCYFYSMLFGLVVLNFGMKFFLPPDIGFIGGIPFIVIGYLPFYAIYTAMYIKGPKVAEQFFKEVGHICYIFPPFFILIYYATMVTQESLLPMFITHTVWICCVIGIVYFTTKEVIEYSSYVEDNDEPKLFQMSFSLDEENSTFLEKHSLLLGKTKEETVEEFIKLGSWCYEHIDSENTIAVINRVTKMVEKER